MRLDRSALPSLATASLRATEGWRSDGRRLFEDTVTFRCLPPLWQGVVRLMCLPAIGPAVFAVRELLTPGVIGGLLCRTRYIDDALRKALAEGCKQVVILGAGFDTRPYRVPGVDETRVVEVDHPAAQALKKACVRSVLGSLPKHVVYLPIDFDRGCLGEALARAGFLHGVQTFFVWEGVTQYITGKAVDATVRTISRIARAGSAVVFTYIWRGIIDGSARSQAEERIVAAARRLGSPWIFGLEPVGVPAYLAERGLTLVEDVGADEYRERYLQPLGRRMNIFEGERTVLARVAGGPGEMPEPLS